MCESGSCRPFMQVDKRDYWRCDACEVTFLEPKQRLAAESELAEYQQHNNDGMIRYCSIIKSSRQLMTKEMIHKISGHHE